MRPYWIISSLVLGSLTLVTAVACGGAPAPMVETMQRVGPSKAVLVSAKLTSLGIHSGPGKGAHHGRPDHATQRR